MIHGTETFPCLRTLNIRDARIEPATLFLQLCHRVPLESLQVTFEDSSIPTSAQMYNFFHSVSTSFVHSSLTNLSLGIDARYFETRDEHLHSISTAALRALLCFSNLTTVEIVAPTWFDIDNAAVRELARAWPCLITLCLVDGFAPSRPNVSLECLDSFVRYCPHLEKLYISLDASVLPPPQVDAQTLCVQDPLTSLNVMQSAIRRPHPIAHLLAARFPALRYVTTWREDPDEDEELRAELSPGEGEAFTFHDRWKEVESLVRAGTLDSSQETGGQNIIASEL
ncbi:hypothetical protein C8R43DRAFT_1200483 [Mycena crocata]|nr:hypothetical protein C8R43DRAFT_1200483 [Mycena crocata]